MRGALALAALAALAPSAHAFLILDDFTEGGFTHVLDLQRSFLHVETGLDRAHSAWGGRTCFTDIVSNPNNTTLEIRVGGGEQAFRTPLPLTWDHDLRLGDNSTSVDLSTETEIWVDLSSEPRAFADIWDVTVQDTNGLTASNGGWLQRGGGIRFRKDQFTRTVDWSRITYLEFTQNWDALPNPLEYQVTRIYAVPEPSLALGFTALLGAAAARRRRPRGRA